MGGKGTKVTSQAREGCGSRIEGRAEGREKSRRKGWRRRKDWGRDPQRIKRSRHRNRARHPLARRHGGNEMRGSQPAARPTPTTPNARTQVSRPGSLQALGRAPTFVPQRANRQLRRIITVTEIRLRELSRIHIGRPISDAYFLGGKGQFIFFYNLLKLEFITSKGASKRKTRRFLFLKRGTFLFPPPFLQKICK